MSATKEPLYACPYIDAVLEPLKELFADLPSEYMKWRLVDIEAVYDELWSLKAVTENSLERVRSICEELREDRSEFERELQNITIQFEDLSEEHAYLKKEYDELMYRYEQLQKEGE